MGQMHDTIQPDNTRRAFERMRSRIKPSSVAAEAAPASSSISPLCSTRTCSSASMRKRSKREESSRPLLMHSGRCQGDLAEKVVVVQQVENAGTIVKAAAE